jgi:phage protein D
MPLRSPYYQVLMEGEDITRWVSAVTVIEDDRQADNVTLTIPDPRMIYADCLFEGTLIQIDLGYAEPNQHALILRAIVTKIDLSYPESGVPAVSLKGQDRSILMGLQEKKKRWRDMTVTAIVRKVGQDNGFTNVQAELNPDPLIRSKPINQDGKTDLAFLQDLAKSYHAKCFVELDEHGDEVLYFLPERRIVHLNRPDTLLLSYRMGPGSNLISFSPTFDGNSVDRPTQVADVDVRGNPIESRDKPAAQVAVWNLDEARMAQANRRDESTIRELYTVGAQRKRDLQPRFASRRPAVGEVTVDQAEVETTNDVTESRSLGMSASGTTFGNIWLRAKSNVQLSGLNERFNGKWYVSSVTHQINGSGYKTDFKCVR